jgi:hypothetical protein
VQAVSVAHDTAVSSENSVLAGTGTLRTDHRTPFQTSASAAPERSRGVSVPVATQNLADRQDTPLSTAPDDPATRGSAMACQRRPSQRKATATSLTPIATHAVAPEQETPLRAPSWAIPGTGWMAHARPFHVSAIAPLFPWAPTAVHAAGPAHETAASDPSGALTFADGTIVHTGLAPPPAWAASAGAADMPPTVSAPTMIAVIPLNQRRPAAAPAA